MEKLEEYNNTNKNKRIWHLFLLSYFIPIVGGILVYILRKKKDKNLASICLWDSIFHPLIIGFIVGFIIYYVGELLKISLDYFIIRGLSIFSALIIGLIYNIYTIKIRFRENEYRYFTPVFWFSLIGVIYSYYFAYKNDKYLRDNVGTFFLLQFLILFIFSPLLSAIFVWLAMAGSI